MGHQKSKNQKTKSNYPSGDSSGRQTYLSLLPRAISSGIINPEFFKKFGTSLAVFSVAFLVALLTSSSFAPVQNSEAKTEVNTIIRATGTYARITAPSQIVLNLESTSGGSAVIGSQVVQTATNSSKGYKLFISTGSTDVDSQKMVLRSEANAIANNHYLSPLPTTSLTSLDSATANTWGYTLKGVYTNPSDSDITTSSKFMGMPLRGHDELIRTENDATSDASGNIIDSTKANTTVYYGAKANTALPSGEYVSTVTYTAVIESNTDTMSVVPYAVPQLSQGAQVTIATPVYMDPSMDLGTITLTVGSKVSTTACSRTAVDNSMAVVLTCSLPEQDFVGEYDLTVAFNGQTYTQSNAILYYVPWDKLQYMQDMTTYACDEIETPSAYNDGSSSAKYAYGPLDVRKIDGTIVTQNNTVITDNDLLANNGALLTTYWSGNEGDYSTVSYSSFGRIANINTGVPEKKLIDVRDGNSYRIRKLADGNCWMTENLRLVFSDDNGTIGDTPTSISISAKGAATYYRTDDGTSSGTAYGPAITISANHKIDENYSNVGKNAVGGSSASNWDTSNFNAGGTAEGSVAYTEIDGYGTHGTGGWTTSYWAGGSGGTGIEDASNTTKHPTTSSNASSYHSNYFARSVYDSITRDSCHTPGEINAKNDEDTNYEDCFIRDNDIQTVGTYYNFVAATAGTGKNGIASDNNAVNLTDSICPAGWQLPYSAANDPANEDASLTKKSYGYLIVEVYANPSDFGTNTSAVVLDARNNKNIDGGTPTNTGAGGYFQTLAGYHVWALTNQIRMAPVSLPFGGVYDQERGTDFNVDSTAHWWSATAFSAERARFLYAYPGRFNATGGNIKGHGANIRCVSQ